MTHAQAMARMRRTLWWIRAGLAFQISLSLFAVIVLAAKHEYVVMWACIAVIVGAAIATVRIHRKHHA